MSVQFGLVVRQQYRPGQEPSPSFVSLATKGSTTPPDAILESMNPALHGSVSVDGPYTAYRVTLADPYVTKKSVGGGYDRNGDTTDLERAKQYLRQQKFTVVG